MCFSSQTVLGDYDSTMKGITKESLYGVDRSQPITPITSASSFNLFDASMKEKMNTTSERRDPVVPAEARPSYPTFGDRHKSNSKFSRQPYPNPSSVSKGSERKGNSRSKVHPYVKPNQVGTPSLPTETSLFMNKPENLELSSTSSKPLKKHKRSSRHPHSELRQPHSDSKQSHSDSAGFRMNKHESTPLSQAEGGASNVHPSLASVGKSLSFTSAPGIHSPPVSDRGTSFLSASRTFRRSSSADNPAELVKLEPTGTNEGDSISFNRQSPIREKKKDRKQKKVKKEKDRQGVSQANSDHMIYSTSHMTSSAIMPDTSRHVPSKPTKLK